MTRATSKDSGVTLTRLGNIVIDCEADATRVKGSNEKKLALLDKMLTLYPKGIHLVGDEDGWLCHRGRVTNNEVLLSRRGQTPIMFEVDTKLRSRRHSTDFTGVLTECLYW